MIQVFFGLKHGVDVSLYADPRFDASQMEILRDLLERGIDPTPFADPHFQSIHMYELRAALLSGLDINTMLDPDQDWMMVHQERMRLDAEKEGSWLITPEGSKWDPPKLRVPFDVREPNLMPWWD